MELERTQSILSRQLLSNSLSILISSEEAFKALTKSVQANFRCTQTAVSIKNEDCLENSQA